MAMDGDEVARTRPREEEANEARDQKRVRSRVPDALQRPGAKLGHVPRSLLIGAYTTQGEGVSRASQQSWVRDVLRLVLDLAKLRPPNLHPRGFLSVNLNHNALLPAHRDKHNLSETWLASFGDHVGGSLWVEAIDNELVDCAGELKPLPRALQGGAPDGLMGFVIPIKHTWTSFSGLRWHAVLPCRGHRLSVSLFSPRHVWRLTPSHWSLLRELGFATEQLRAMAEREAVRRATPAASTSSSLPSVPCVAASPTPPCSPQPPKPKDMEQSLTSSSAALLRRLRFQGGSDFAFYVRAVQHACRLLSPGCECSRPALPSASMMFLPWGIPFPECWADVQNVPSSRRRQQRWHREKSLRELGNIMILALNWTCLGCVFSEELVAISACPCSETQLSLLEPVLDELRAWSRSGGSFPVDGGLSRLLASLKRHSDGKAAASHYTTMGATTEDLFSCFVETKQLSPSTMALPTISAQTPVTSPTVPSEIQGILEEENAFLVARPPSTLSRTFTSVSSWPAVAAEMLRRRLATLIPSEIGVHHRGQRVSAGLFGVEKKGTSKSRVIIDRRSQNCCEQGLRAVVLDRVLGGELTPARGSHLLRLMTLPYFAQFSKLVLSGTSEISITTEDAADYYYGLALPFSLVRTNVVGSLLYSQYLSDAWFIRRSGHLAGGLCEVG
eukprot:6476890-Amphidinium_carterae.2